MIPENREQTEQQQNIESCIQALESYLRQEANYEAMSNSMVAAGMEKRLAMKAKDYCIKYDMQLPEEVYIQIAREAITRYLHNWKGKVQGEDDRGHRLGKSHYMNVMG